MISKSELSTSQPGIPWRALVTGLGRAAFYTLSWGFATHISTGEESHANSTRMLQNLFYIVKLSHFPNCLNTKFFMCVRVHAAVAYQGQLINILWNCYGMAYNLENVGLLISLPPKCILYSYSPYLFQWFFLIQARHCTRTPILSYPYRKIRIQFALGKTSGCKEKTTQN